MANCPYVSCKPCLKINHVNICACYSFESIDQCVPIYFGLRTMDGGGTRQLRKRFKTDPSLYCTEDMFASHLDSSDTTLVSESRSSSDIVHLSADGDEPTQHHADIYRKHMQDIFVANKLSATDTQTLSDLSSSAGAKGVHDFARCGNKFSTPGSTERDLLRNMKASVDMPEPYYAEILCRDPDTNRNRVPMMMPVLLLHEIMFWIISSGRALLKYVNASLLPKESGRFNHMSKFCESHNIPIEQMIPIGMHGDGVPFQKKQTVEVMSWDMIAGTIKEIILFSLIGKRYVCQCGCHGRCTLD